MAAPNDNPGCVGDLQSRHEAGEIGGQWRMPGEPAAMPWHAEPGGMERVAWQQQAGLEIRGPTVSHPGEVLRAVTRVEFIAEDRMTAMRQMDADLVHPAGFRKTPDQGKPPFRPCEATLHHESRVA